MNKEIAHQWGTLSEEERQRYDVLATKMQSERSHLVRQPLNVDLDSAASQCDSQDSQVSVSKQLLNPKQVGRLNQARLDASLAQVVRHSAWSHGLGISDHICALKPQHVDMSMDPASLDAQYHEYFGFDSKIVQNPPLPPFDRACTFQNGGICTQSRYFKYVSKLAAQLDAVFVAAGVIASNVLIKLTLHMRRWVSAEPPKDHLAPCWFVLGCVGRKPKFHVWLRLNDCGSGLGIKLIKGVPHVETSHRTLNQYMAKNEKLGQPPCNFGLEVP